MVLSPLRRGLAIVALTLGAGACSSTTAAPGAEDRGLLRAEPLTVDGVVVGEQYSGLRTRERLVVRDATEWAALWSRITANVEPAPPLPTVPFEREQLIVVASGTKPTGGYAIAVAEVRMEHDALRVVVRETEPGARCVTTQALTAPVAVVRTPRSDLPVVFEEARETVDCP